MTATIEGATYEIPEMWLCGFCRNGATVLEAVQHWHEQALMEAEFEAQQAKPRAVVRHKPTHILILCPMGHLIEAHEMNRDFAGSAFEAELGLWQAGRANRFDRLAATCQGAGHDSR